MLQGFRRSSLLAPLRFALAWPIVALAALTPMLGCGDDGVGDDADRDPGDETGPSTDGDQDAVCYDIPVNTTDGGESCNIEQCPPGAHCADGACLWGCVAATTCPKGQYCDTTTASTGTCRAPGPEHEMPCNGESGCDERCQTKAASCGAGAAASAICGEICGSASDEQVDCLEDTPCAELQDGEACGLTFSTPGEGSGGS